MTPFYGLGEMIPVPALGRLLRPDRPLHVSTIYRWAERGVRGHRLAIVRIGGGGYVRTTDLRAFLAALNEGQAPPEIPDAAAEKAGLELASRGA